MKGKNNKVIHRFNILKNENLLYIETIKSVNKRQMTNLKEIIARYISGND
jgi:hypothetical protein